MFVHVGNQDLEESLSPSLGNGALAYNVRSPYFYLSLIYNGLGTDSHKAAIPNPQVYKVVGAELSFSALDLRYATFTRVYTVPDSTCTVTHTQYVHSLFTLTHLMVGSIEVSNVNGTTPCRIEVVNAAITTSPDLAKVVDTTNPSYIIHEYTTMTSEDPTVAVRKIAVLAPRFSSVVIASPGQTSTLPLYSAVADTTISNDPVEDVKEMWTTAQNQGLRGLWSEQVTFHQDHRQGVEVTGNLALAQKINASRYSLEIDIGQRTFGSSSSHGLATTADDQGRISWDAENWIFPSATVLRPFDVASTFMAYRAKRLEAARAKAGNNGYSGAMFPWESGLSGIELCTASTASNTNCLLKQYVSGNVALAVRHYFYASRDIDFLKKYANLVEESARFFASRAKPSSAFPGAYEIARIATPDDASGVVTNSAYVNQIAKLTLEWFLEMGQYIYIYNDFEAHRIAKGLIIPFDEEKQMHLAYEGYKGQAISAADVVLLNYPLQAPMNNSIVKNDLTYYQAKLNVEKTPATTWAMHTIGWLQVGETERAEETFNLSSKYMMAPYGVWHESDTDTAPNYVSGAGAYLQSIIFGYGGLRVTAHGHVFKPTLPPGTDSMILRHFMFHHTGFDVYVDATTIKITCIQDDDSTPLVFLTTNRGGPATPLILNHSNHMPYGTTFTIGYKPGEVKPSKRSL